MLLSETLRNLVNEENLYDTGDVANSKSTVGGWSDLFTETITLSEAKKIVVRCDVYFVTTGTGDCYVKGNGRIVVDDKPAISTGFIDFETSG